MDFRTDVAVLAYFEDDPRLWVSCYSRDAIVAFGRRDHPLFARSRTGIRLPELHGQPMIAREHGSNTRRASDAAMAQAGIVPRIVMEIGSREAVREAVASGAGFGFVSSAESIADGPITSLPILDAEIYNDANIVCLRDRIESRMIAALLGVRKHLRSQDIVRRD